MSHVDFKKWPRPIQLMIMKYTDMMVRKALGQHVLVNVIVLSLNVIIV